MKEDGFIGKSGGELVSIFRQRAMKEVRFS
jgi:hypothetical protein